VFAARLVDDRSKAASLFARGTKMLFLMLYPITLLIATFAYEVLRLWLGASFADHSTRVLQWLAAGVFVNSLAQIPFALLQSAGRGRRDGEAPPDGVARVPGHRLVVDWPRGH